MACWAYQLSLIHIYSALILSRFAGVADEFKDYAIMVNPYDIEGVADSIKIALEMDHEQKISRFENLKEIVKKRDVFYWLESIFKSFTNLVEKEAQEKKI